MALSVKNLKKDREWQASTGLEKIKFEALLPYFESAYVAILGVGIKEAQENLQQEFYFARPYHSWERSSNEYLNGLIRQFIPKKTDFSQLTDDYIQEVEDRLNRRPRKRFGYKTPLEQAQTYFSNAVAFTT